MSVDLVIAMAMVSGLNLRVDGADLVVVPRSKLTPDLEHLLLDHKVEIITALQSGAAPAGTFLKDGRVWVPPPERKGWCPCDESRVWDLQSGLCGPCYSAVCGTRLCVGAGGISSVRAHESSRRQGDKQ